MELFRYAKPEYLYLLWLLPLFVALFVIVLLMRKKAVRKFGDLAIIESLMPNVSIVRLCVKFGLLLLAFSAIVMALARPQFGAKLEKVKRRGVEIIIALDVSNSMNCQDIAPSRLEKAKMAISKLIDGMQNDKIGIVIFAGDAYTQLPITADYGAAKLFVNTVKTNYIQEQGTAIGKSLELGMTSFSDDPNVGKAIIVISDGENHEDDAIAKAKECVTKNIVVHTIGMGTPDGAPIPADNRLANDFLKDRDGNVIITKLDEKMLRDIAIAGNGMFVRASNSDAGLDVLFDHINKMDKKDIESKIYTDFDEKFQFFLLIAIALLLIDFLIIERKNKLIKRIRLFDVDKELKIKN